MIKTFIFIQIYLLTNLSLFIILIHSFPRNYKFTHPLIIITNLFLLLLISSIYLSIFINNHWYSYLIFIIIVGGIIVIFIYFIRFINNIKTSFKWIKLKNLPIKISILFITFRLTLFYLKTNNWNFNFNEIINLLNNNFNKSNNLSILYLIPINKSTLIAIIYILICMTIIVKICLNKKLTLRKFN